MAGSKRKKEKRTMPVEHFSRAKKEKICRFRPYIQLDES